jgi:tRNA 2-thiouridine synthesizing protein B
MRLGFLLTKTPSEEGYNTFTKFIEIYSTNDLTVYLLGNGVYNFRRNYGPSENLMKLLEKSPSFKIYACQDDLEARGIGKETLFNEVIIFKDYNKIVVDIMENQDQIFSF